MLNNQMCVRLMIVLWRFTHLKALKKRLLNIGLLKNIWNRTIDKYLLPWGIVSYHWLFKCFLYVYLLQIQFPPGNKVVFKAYWFLWVTRVSLPEMRLETCEIWMMEFFCKNRLTAKSCCLQKISIEDI